LATATATREGTAGIRVDRAVGIRVIGFTACPCTQELLRTLARDKLRKLSYNEEQIEEVLENTVCATHTQRTLGTLLISSPQGSLVNVDDLATILENSMSGQTYTILKRPAEATVVENAQATILPDVVRGSQRRLKICFPNDVPVFVRCTSNECHRRDIMAENHDPWRDKTRNE
jgi:GTP cyclohydrolase-4